MKAIELDHDMVLEAARLMESQGGSFAGHIARAYYVADSTNRVRLLTAFDDLFVRYYKEHRRDQLIQGESK
jgi:hypothetical protein